MKILYNPSENECPEYNFNGSRVNVGGLGSKKLKQYDDSVAEDMLERWEFLQPLSADQAKELLERPNKQFKCQHCDFATDAKIALSGHMRTHKVEADKSAEPVVDPSLIPTDEAKPVAPPRTVSGRALQEAEDNLILDYGEGLTEEIRDFRAVPPVGQGHFRG